MQPCGTPAAEAGEHDGVSIERVCREQCMAFEPCATTIPAMHPTVVSSPSRRPPDNELYDRGCDLVEAATAIRRLASDPRAARALPAVLGCLEAALHELRGACPAMEQTTDSVTRERERPGPNDRRWAVADRMHRGFTHLERALNDAEVAASATRSLAARSLGA